MLAADEIERRSIGIDIEQDFADFAATRTRSPYIVGDAAEILAADAHLDNGSIDYIFTSPPYFAMLHFGKGANKRQPA